METGAGYEMIRSQHPRNLLHETSPQVATPNPCYPALPVTNSSKGGLEVDFVIGGKNVASSPRPVQPRRTPFSTVGAIATGMVQGWKT
jgi:hypothetical protein